MFVSIIVSTLTALSFALLSDYIFALFTQNTEVIALYKTIMFIDIGLEFARAINMVMVRAFQTSGDVMYPTILAIISCWLIATVLSFVFGIVLKMGLAGVWIAMMIDELFRAALFIVRYIRGKWLKKNLVQYA
jgi:Na+-driven multidrug efflux pump